MPVKLVVTAARWGACQDMVAENVDLGWQSSPGTAVGDMDSDCVGSSSEGAFIVSILPICSVNIVASDR